MFTWKHLSKTLASFLQNKTYLLFKKIMIIAIKKSLSKIVPVHFLVRLQTPWPCVWKKNWSNKKNSVQNGLNTNHIFLHQTKLIECCSLFFSCIHFVCFVYFFVVCLLTTTVCFSFSLNIMINRVITCKCCSSFCFCSKF